MSAKSSEPVKAVAAAAAATATSVAGSPRAAAAHLAALKAETATQKTQALSVIVAGATGDLAKKKTFPALYGIYLVDGFPERVRIFGYGRRDIALDALKEQLRPFLLKLNERSHPGTTKEKVENFLQLLDFHRGQYDSEDDVAALAAKMDAFERTGATEAATVKRSRLFIFAIPPFVFIGFASAVKKSAMTPTSDGTTRQGWTRLIVEKPFGRDTASSDELSNKLTALYEESQLFRIDHYLGKEMVQNLLIMRFANQMFEPIWNREHVACVYITFKEPFGTEGRGGYFDKYGIIRDVMQNHLLQVLSLVAMEPPTGDMASGNGVRTEKVRLLKAVRRPIDLKEVVIGQYVKSEDGSKPGYKDDDGVPKDSNTPTFASMVFHIDNDRWRGVPFIMRAGKATDQRKVDVRLQLRTPKGAASIFPENAEEPLRNELVLRVQPNEAVFMRVNVKAPGTGTKMVQSELDLTYKNRYGKDFSNPDAYTRMFVNVIEGNQSTFVRSDELKEAWEIFTPLLHSIEKGELKPVPYVYGSRGPPEADQLAIKAGDYSERNLKLRLAAGPRDDRADGDSAFTEREKKASNII